MSKSIYEAFDATTRNLSAYAIFGGANSVGRVIFTRARSGCRTTCWLQIWGAPMVKGIANGGGYDKDSAAFIHAADKLRIERDDDAKAAEYLSAFSGVLDNGRRWKDQLEEVGYTVQHVID